MSNRAAYGYRAAAPRVLGKYGRIWGSLESRKIFHMGVQIGNSDRSARARPVVPPLLLYHTGPALSIGKMDKN